MDSPPPTTGKRPTDRQEPTFWRSLEEWADTESFRKMLRAEFPSLMQLGMDGLPRRRFLQWTAASLALAGLTGCSPRPPAEQIVPFRHAPEHLVPGRPLFYASAMTHRGLATGVLIETHEGRPTKVEGNPNHPASLGASDAFAQASILTFYDPDRSQEVLFRGEPSTWQQAEQAIGKAIGPLAGNGYQGLHILTGTVTSPTLQAQLQRLLEQFPGVRWHIWEPVGRENVLHATRMAFGREAEPIYHFDRAEVIVSLDADFLYREPGRLVYGRALAERRRVRDENIAPRQATMSRLYAVETSPGLTGVVADHRWGASFEQVRALAAALAARLDDSISGTADGSLPFPETVLAAIIDDLRQHPGRSLVLAGEDQPPEVHVLAYACNRALGNIGQTVSFIPPPAARIGDGTGTLAELAEALRTGSAKVVLFLGTNPVYDAPADLDLVKLLRAENVPAENRPLKIHLGMYPDETAALCDWHLPQTHYLEQWADARAFDGTASLMQPTIAPLYDGRSEMTVLGWLSPSEPRLSDHQRIQAFWRSWWEKNFPDAPTDPLDRDFAFDQFWRKALHDGVVPQTAFEPLEPTWQEGWQQQIHPSAGGGTASTTVTTAIAAAVEEMTIEVVFRPDPNVFDGRYANNGWLQELPKPITKLVWDNPLLMSSTMAGRLGIELPTQPFNDKSAGTHGTPYGPLDAPVVRLIHGDRSIEVPVWVLPGHPDSTATLWLGYGRTRAGNTGSEQGVSAYPLRPGDSPSHLSKVTVERTSRRAPLVCTQNQFAMEGRDLIRHATLEHYQEHPDFAQPQQHHADSTESDEKQATPPEREQWPRQDRPSLYPEYAYDDYKWGMTIDLNACIGCNACVVACQAENNIPVIGKDQVAAGRIMHWLRVDRYFEGPVDRPRTHFQPVACMHCEKAPCELVCPVGATVHSDEGLNEMVYNRCVGTLYCSNNCPYKVRRFNFFQYTHPEGENARMRYNPDVTVRSRGVMEKCTYCVQRISQARIEAGRQGGKIAAGGVVTACQAACPTGAIRFGDLNRPEGPVTSPAAEPLRYELLAELNTQPRTSYFASLRNPNPRIESIEEAPE